MMKVFMGIPSTGTRSDAQCYALREMEERYKDSVTLVYPKQCVYRTFHDFARNSIVDEFLASDCDMIWFLDSDICPPISILDIITEHGNEWEAAGAPYPIWLVPPGCKDQSIVYTAYKGIVDGVGIQMASVPHSGTEFIDGLATGCLFLKRSVFQKLEKPYFEFKYDPITRRLVEGEDLGFCIKAAKVGIKFFVDYGKVCKHYKTVCLLDIQNYATDMSNSKIVDYDREIRSKVEGAINASYQKGVMDERANLLAHSQQRVSESGLILPANFSRG